MADVQLANGQPVTPDHKEIDPKTGMQRQYVVLTPEERAKGFVRPLRLTYLHVGENAEFRTTENDYAILIKPGPNACGTRTTMSQPIAETYARDPYFYSGTFCVACQKHFGLEEFVWEGTTEVVGA